MNETKKKLAIIGANEFQDPLIRTAQRMGFETHVFAWQAGDIGERTADVFHPISITEREAIWDVCRQVGVAACCSIGSDLAVHTVNYIQRRLGNPCNPEICDTVATNKYAMRRALSQAGVSCPRFLTAAQAPAPQNLEGMGWPLIVKPTDRSGSRGIFKVDGYQQLKAAVPQSAALSFEKKAIIEQFITGTEYSCESISFAGKHHILALTKKFTTGAPHFIETGHIEPADIPADMLPAVTAQVQAALDALHIAYGASHAEFLLTPEGEVRIVEVGARMGGDCIGSDLVYLSTGIDYMAAVIQAACGQAPDLTSRRTPRRAQIRFICTDRDAAELEQARRTAPESIWRAVYSGRADGPVTDSATRHGYWITEGAPL